jgi:hypothetical protein
VISGVSAMTVIRLSAAATIGDTSVRAPAPSLTAVWDRLPPQARPPSKPEPRLASPRAIISWLDSSR